jgi:hypothetical protein
MTPDELQEAASRALACPLGWATGAGGNRRLGPLPTADEQDDRKASRTP